MLHSLWREEIENCYYQKALHRLRVIDNKYLPEVMLQFMFWASSQSLFRGRTGHSTIAHLTAVTLKEIEIPQIPMDYQKEIKSKFDELEEVKKSTSEKITASKALQKSLINLTFTQKSGDMRTENPFKIKRKKET